MSNQTSRTQTSDDAILDEVLKRSATDREFRTRLVAQPSSALAEVIGAPESSLPQNVNVKFVEKDAGVDLMLVLPDFIDAEGVLSDAELEAVAGGDDCWTTCWFTATKVETNICRAEN
jgi:hypothetical protein